MTESAVERYLLLGLRLGRHVEGIVDAYYGPPDLAATVAAEKLVDPAALVAEADTLLAELDDGWLRDQVVGVRTYAGVLAGERYSYADEVEGCYGVRPTHTDESVFEAAHERLAELLPGDGELAERYQRWRDSMRVPADLIEPTVAGVIDEAREWTRRLIDLPDGEGVVMQIVRGEPWLAFHDYLGDLRGRVSVNVDLPMSAMDLLHLTAHETYPGHQAERCVKEHLLVLGQGRLEETLVLVPTQQSLVSEGLAELGASVLLDGPAGPALAGVARAAGVEFDLAHARTIERAFQSCRWAEINAALMLHEAGADEDEVHAYLLRWGLVTPEVADHVIRFMTEPTSRTYVIAYPAGRDLCDGFVAGDPVRFGRLLTEQVRVSDLRAEGAGTST